MVESFLIHNLPLFCLTFDQQFTISAYKDFLKPVPTINLHLDYQLYSLLKCLFLCGSLIVKCVHLRTVTLFFPHASLAMYSSVYFLVFKTAYFDTLILWHLYLVFVYCISFSGLVFPLWSVRHSSETCKVSPSLVNLAAFAL